MPVVSNTSPILNLAIIGRLEFLHQQFGVVLIPPAVIDELQLTSGRPGVFAIRGAIQTGRLQTTEAPDARLVALLRRELDQGESEAIAMALDIKPDYVLLDERDARRVASHRD